ncbi:KAT8 regulatory NSL complex subunit 1 [Halotydeus destructor]|nr:KAT8 regulatory NSL complex subunit 1 [Halotydeus destructor]
MLTTPGINNEGEEIKSNQLIRLEETSPSSAPPLSTTVSSSATALGTSTLVASDEADSVNQTVPSNKCSTNNKDEGAFIQQCHLEKQAGELLKRIYRLQGRQAIKHVDRQLVSFVRHEQSTSGIGCQGRDYIKPPSDVRGGNSVRFSVQNSAKMAVGSTAEDKIKLFSPEGVKNLSTSALVSLVKKLESSNHNSYGDTSLPQNSAYVPVEELSTQSSPNTNAEHSTSSEKCTANQDESILCGSLVDTEELKQTVEAAGIIKSNLKHLEEDYDSDATESSSGGESADELLAYDYSNSSNDQSSHSNRKHASALPSLKRRANWKWAVDRGTMASRWMWLIAQVADLEFKIRQQSELYRTLRHSKGQIILEANMPLAAPSSIASSSLAMKEQVTSPTLNTTINSSTQVTSTVTPLAPDAENSENNADNSSNAAPSTVSEVNCVRTLPVRQIRRRKVVRSMNALSGATKKSARLSTVQCSCSSQSTPLVSPCVLCNGRYSYVQVIDTDCMPLYERVALLDPSFHSVLSLPNNVYLGLQFSKMLKKETIQKPISSKSQYKRRKSALSPEYSNKFGKDIRKTNSRKKSQAIISSNNLRKKYAGAVKRKHTHGDLAGSKRSKRERHESSSNGSAECSSRHESPIPSPLPLDGSNGPVGQRRRRSEQHAYDINNIIIPYSIASTTRVEKLQYKEIVTPKWRVHDMYAITDETSKISKATENGGSLEEDLSDEIYTIRHLKCEVDEKRRFLTFVTPGKGKVPSRKTVRMRCDSKTEGTNGFSETLDTSSQDSFSVSSNAKILTTGSKDDAVHGTPARTAERRRTTSSSRTREDSFDDDHQHHYLSPDITPFEKRCFPLPADELELIMAAFDGALDEDDEEPQAMHVDKKDKDIKKEEPESPINGKADLHSSNNHWEKENVETTESKQ